MKYRYFVSFSNGTNLGNAMLVTNTRVENLTSDKEVLNWISGVEKCAARNVNTDHVILLSYQFINTVSEESEE